MIRILAKIPNISHLKAWNLTPSQYLNTYRAIGYVNLNRSYFCTEKKDNKKINDFEDEIAKKRKVQEQLEIAKLKREMNIPNAKRTMNFQLLTILKPWIIRIFLFFGAVYTLKQIFQLTEVILDPLSGKKKRQLIGPAAEKKLANSVTSILKLHFRIIDSNDPRYKRIQKIYSMFSNNSMLKQFSFQFNSEIYIIDSDDLVFCLLRNGSLFISRALVDMLKNDKDIIYLMIHDLSHHYLRSMIRGMTYLDFFRLLEMSNQDFKTRVETEYDFLKRLYFNNISRKQEEKAVSF